MRRGFGLIECVLVALGVAVVALVVVVVVSRITWSDYKERHSCYEFSRTFKGATPTTNFIQSGKVLVPITTYHDNYTVGYQCDSGKIWRSE